MFSDGHLAGSAPAEGLEAQDVAPRRRRPDSAADKYLPAFSHARAAHHAVALGGSLSAPTTFAVGECLSKRAHIKTKVGDLLMF